MANVERNLETCVNLEAGVPEALHRRVVHVIEIAGFETFRAIEPVNGQMTTFAQTSKYVEFHRVCVIRDALVDSYLDGVRCVGEALARSGS